MSIKTSGRVWLVVICLLLGAIFFIRTEPSRQKTQMSMPPIFDTADWMNTQMPGRLLIRRASDNNDILLTMRDEFEKGKRQRAVYEYDPLDQVLRKVPDLKWDDTTSAIAGCFSQQKQSPERLKVNGEKLFLANQEIPVKGKILISAAYSPGGDAVAILSADGPRKGSIMPFLGGGQNSKGQHYHQLFYVANGKPIDEALRLRFTTEKQSYSACWSGDNKYVFYTSLLADRITIVKTGL